MFNFLLIKSSFKYTVLKFNFCPFILSIKQYVFLFWSVLVLYSVILLSSVQLLSLVWLCDPLDCSMPCFSVCHQHPELVQTHVHWVSDAVQPSHSLLSPSPPALQSFPASGSFAMSQFFPSGGQSPGASASASVLPMIIKGWFSLELTYLISL